MSVVQAFKTETILEFIHREGSVTTMSVAARFGLDMQDARKALNKLRREGVIESRRYLTDYCAMNGWRVSRGKMPQ